MHPILAHRRRLAPYLVPWVLLGLLFSVVLQQIGGSSWHAALGLAVPLMELYAFICLAAWFPTRATGLERPRLWQAASRHVLAALLSVLLWLVAGSLWASLIDRSPLFAGAAELFVHQLTLFAVVGLLLYSLAAAGSYVYLALEMSSRSQSEAAAARQREELAARELHLARALQRRLLPPVELHRPAFALAARNLAAQGVAGDFYDYFEAADGSLWVAVADVAGKGMAASLIMATVKAILPLIARDRSPVDTLCEINGRLHADLAPREFVAMALVRFDPERGEIELVNAGLPDPYLLSPDGLAEVLEVPFPRLPLGLRAQVDYASVHASLDPGQRLLMLTDGLPEAPVAVGEPLGYERLPSFFDHLSPDPAAWLGTLLERVRGATLDEQDDDWTAVLLEHRRLEAVPVAPALGLPGVART